MAAGGTSGLSWPATFAPASVSPGPSSGWKMPTWVPPPPPSPVCGVQPCSMPSSKLRMAGRDVEHRLREGLLPGAGTRRRRAPEHQEAHIVDVVDLPEESDQILGGDGGRRLAEAAVRERADVMAGRRRRRRPQHEELGEAGGDGDLERLVKRHSRRPSHALLTPASCKLSTHSHDLLWRIKKAPTGCNEK